MRAMRILAALLVVGMLLAARPAEAQETARELYDRATAQYALGKYMEAAVIFESAFELKPDPAILYNAAQAHRLANNKARALELYMSYLRLYGDKVPGSRAEVQRHIDSLRTALDKDHQAANQAPLNLKPQTTKPAPAPTTPPPTTTAKPAPVVAKVTVAPKPTPPPVVTEPKPKPAPPPVVTTPPTSTPTPAVVVTSPPPPKKKIKPWVWGVVAGAVIVVGVGVGVGVAIGTRGTKDPDPTFGIANGN